jgi:hypothetical protein
VPAAGGRSFATFRIGISLVCCRGGAQSLFADLCKSRCVSGVQRSRRGAHSVTARASAQLLDRGRDNRVPPYIAFGNVRNLLMVQVNGPFALDGVLAARTRRPLVGLDRWLRDAVRYHHAQHDCAIASNNYRGCSNHACRAVAQRAHLVWVQKSRSSWRLRRHRARRRVHDLHARYVIIRAGQWFRRIMHTGPLKLNLG